MSLLLLPACERMKRRKLRTIGEAAALGVCGVVQAASFAFGGRNGEDHRSHRRVPLLSHRPTWIHYEARATDQRHVGPEK